MSCVPCNSLGIPIQNQPLDGTYQMNTNPTGNNNIVINQITNALTTLSNLFRPQPQYGYQPTFQPQYGYGNNNFTNIFRPQPQYMYQSPSNLSTFFRPQPQQYYGPQNIATLNNGQPGCPFYGCNPPESTLQNLLNQDSNSCPTNALII
jgi:hypothetical protein